MPASQAAASTASPAVGQAEDRGLFPGPATVRIAAGASKATATAATGRTRPITGC